MTNTYKPDEWQCFVSRVDNSVSSFFTTRKRLEQSLRGIIEDHFKDAHMIALLQQTFTQAIDEYFSKVPMVLRNAYTLNVKLYLIIVKFAKKYGGVNVKSNCQVF
jgi:hypothetical protein